MNIVKSGDILQIYGSSIETFDNIPSGTYRVEFSKMTGFFLVQKDDLEITEKMYGKMVSKVNKVFNTFNNLDRNFGIILSGQKGSGKTMFAKAISQEGASYYNIPTIFIDTYIHGIANFLSSINQEVILLFDEFEKNFHKTDEGNPQEELLSLFDGLDMGAKKFFIVTCNDTKDLSNFLLNRPGRFHYHFKMNGIDEEAIQEYLKDKLLPKYYNNIDKIINLSKFMTMTYDYLRAIVFDVNNGYSLKESLEDLNIEFDMEGLFSCIVTLEDGTVLKSMNPEFLRLNKDSYENFHVFFKDKKNKVYGNIPFKISNIKINNNRYIINPKEINIEWQTDLWNNEEADKLIEQLEQTAEIQSIELIKENTTFVSAACAYGS